LDSAACPAPPVPMGLAARRGRRCGGGQADGEGAGLVPRMCRTSFAQGPRQRLPSGHSHTGVARMMLRHALLPICLLAAGPSLAESRGFDVRDLVKLERVSSPVLSPQGRVVVFAQRSVDADLKATNALYARHLL